MDPRHEIDPRMPASWDERLRTIEGAGIFHSSAWIRVLADSYGFTPACRITDDAVLAMMEVSSIFTGRRGVALPFTDEAPALGSSPEAISALIGESMELGRSRGWKRIEFRGGAPFGPAAMPSAQHLTHSINLEPSPDRLFAGLGGATRRAIRKAEASGVEVTIERGDDGMRAFRKLNALTRRQHGLPPQPGVFFDNIRRHILGQDMGFIILAHLAGQPAAAAMFMHCGYRAMFKYAASDKRHQAARPSNLAMWKGILACRDAGCRTLSLGRTDCRNEGLLRYKRGWSGIETPLNYYTYSLEHDTLVTDPDRLTGIHNACFRMLPLPLSRLAGALIYRHFA